MFSAIHKTIAGISEQTLNERIFIQIRLPRVIMSILVGATLAVGGVLTQALFRNPIVEPGLIGTSSGAAFGAALYFVLGSWLKVNMGEWTLPVAAFIGALLSTTLVFKLSKSNHSGTNSVFPLLLIGVAINALFYSGIGFLSYIARDPQARSITFWNLGTLSGSNWHSVIIISIFSMTCLLASIPYAKKLNALMLGEDEASYLGINIKNLKQNIIIINVVMISVSTAFVGVISFVGLIVPHLLRSIHGSDNRFLISNGIVLGGVILSLSDLVARVIFSPAELPIGIVTSVIGAPVFIILLRKKNYFF